MRAHPVKESLSLCITVRAAGGNPQRRAGRADSTHADPAIAFMPAPVSGTANQQPVQYRCVNNTEYRQAIFNQGNIHTFNEIDLIEAMEKAESLCKIENKEGIKMKDKFTYKNTLERILE